MRRMGKLVSTFRARLCLVKLSSTLSTQMRWLPAVTLLAKSIDHSWLSSKGSLHQTSKTVRLYFEIVANCSYADLKDRA